MQACCSALVTRYDGRNRSQTIAPPKSHQFKEILALVEAGEVCGKQLLMVPICAETTHTHSEGSLQNFTFFEFDGPASIMGQCALSAQNSDFYKIKIAASP